MNTSCGMPLIISIDRQISENDRLVRMAGLEWVGSLTQFLDGGSDLLDVGLEGGLQLLEGQLIVLELIQDILV